MNLETEAVNNVTKPFKYTFPTCSNEEVLFKLEVPVQIPYDGSTRELVQRVIKMFHIPVYLEDELNEKLAQFVADETKNFHNDRDENLINQLKNGELNVEGIVKNWERSFKENVMEFAEQKGTSDEEVFAAAYHKLVHSPACEMILSVENSYAKTFSELRKNRDEDIKQLTAKQTEEMEEKVRQLNITTTEEEINELATQHFEEQSMVAGRWGSQLDALWQTQRTQFRAWLMSTLDEYQSTAALNTPSNSPLGTFCNSLPPSIPDAPIPRLEESFTIHLGSQLKQTHNVRIVAADVVEVGEAGEVWAARDGSLAARRLAAALALCGADLCGAVLATDAPPARPAHPSAALAAAAAAATDHHFDHVDTQLKNITERTKEPVEMRYARRAKELQAAGEAVSGAQYSQYGGPHKYRNKPSLGAGDVFITKHSNLPDVHVVFHLIVDEHRNTEMTSRHPAILGLRNILKTACCNDITSICLPLLLRHELTEEMTVGWCARRAELVLKCVKGFVLEAAGGGGGADLRTLTVALPPATPAPLFHALAHLLPAVFRVATPRKIHASTATATATA